MKIKSNIGITLISLIVTIVVLLILSGVTINSITGSESAMEKAAEARERNNNAAELDAINLAVINAISKDYTSFVSASNLKKSLNGLVTNLEDIADGSSGPWLVVGEKSKRTYIIYENGIVHIAWGTPQKEELYGKDVLYTSFNGTTDWKLFYQNEYETYIISTELKNSVKPSNYYNAYNKDSFNSPTNVSKILNPKLYLEKPELFKSEELNKNMKALAWYCDTDYWKGYTSENTVASADGNSPYAIIAPSIELFVKSHNSDISDINYTILKMEEIGDYGYNTPEGTLNPLYNNGIYNTGQSYWWIASPYQGRYDLGLSVRSDSSGISTFSVDYWQYSSRPIVCIPNSIFQESWIQ